MTRFLTFLFTSNSKSNFHRSNRLVKAFAVLLRHRRQQNFSHFLASEIIVGIFLENRGRIKGFLLPIAVSRRRIAVAILLFLSLIVTRIDQRHVHFHTGFTAFALRRTCNSEITCVSAQRIEIEFFGGQTFCNEILHDSIGDLLQRLGLDAAKKNFDFLWMFIFEDAHARNFHCDCSELFFRRTEIRTKTHYRT